MMALAALALALAVVALVSLGGELTNEIIVRRIEGERDPRVIASAADVLQRRGMHLAAEGLRARARRMPSVVTPASSASSGGPVSVQLACPLAGVEQREWTAFVAAMATQRPDYRSTDGHLGAFETHLRWLRAYGCVGRVWRLEDGRLEADWIAPRSEAAFLGSLRLQYRVFAVTVKALQAAVERRYGRSGVRVGERRGTTSGLIAVAYRLEMGGLSQWLASPLYRSQRPDVWRLFESTNGLF